MYGVCTYLPSELPNFEEIEFGVPNLGLFDRVHRFPYFVCLNNSYPKHRIIPPEVKGVFLLSVGSYTFSSLSVNLEMNQTLQSHSCFKTCIIIIDSLILWREISHKMGLYTAPQIVLDQFAKVQSL